MSYDMRHSTSGQTLFRNLRIRVDIIVPTIEARDAIKVYRRRWGMIVYVSDDEDDTGFYYLYKPPGVTDLGDNENWRELIAEYPIGYFRQEAVPDEEELKTYNIWVRTTDMRLFHYHHMFDGEMYHHIWIEQSSPPVMVE